MSLGAEAERARPMIERNSGLVPVRGLKCMMSKVAAVDLIIGRTDYQCKAVSRAHFLSILFPAVRLRTGEQRRAGRLRATAERVFPASARSGVARAGY